MALFKRNKPQQDPNRNVVGFTKQKKFLFFKIKSKPIYQQGAGAQGFTVRQPIQQPQRSQQPAQKQAAQQPQAHRPVIEKKLNPLQTYIAKKALSIKGLEESLRENNIKESPYGFVKKMFINSVIVAVVITIALVVLLAHYGVNVILAVLLGIAVYYAFFNRFIRFPIDKSKSIGKDVEKNILFAARDLIIGMRSGMPLFNAMTAVSTGYGATSREFAKVIELVQLGMPIEQAIEDVSARSQSPSFKRIMLQASVSLKSGADVVGALQSVVDEVQQERVIELRRYGQRLNALAMFYMLFGVIFPSMGIAVAAILTTFISLFSITFSTLVFTLVGIFFLQLIFLNIMRSSRPTFAM